MNHNVSLENSTPHEQQDQHAHRNRSNDVHETRPGADAALKKKDVEEGRMGSADCHLIGSVVVLIPQDNPRQMLLTCPALLWAAVNEFGGFSSSFFLNEFFSTLYDPSCEGGAP